MYSIENCSENCSFFVQTFLQCLKKIGQKMFNHFHSKFFSQIAYVFWTFTGQLMGQLFSHEYFIATNRNVSEVVSKRYRTK